MAERTHVNADRINAAEAKIGDALDSVWRAVEQLNNHTRDFYTAAGTDDKNGNLKQQSGADMDNKDAQYNTTSAAVQKDKESARSAYAQYACTEEGNVVALKVDPDGLHIVGFE